MKWKGLTKIFLVGAGMALATDCLALDLVKEGRPVATIVLPAETEYDALLKTLTPAEQKKAKALGDDEQLAAEELQSILEKISGAKLAIQRGDALPTGPSIVLGAALARQAGFGEDIDKLAKDGLLCSVKGDSLFLSGRRARGTLFAAYDFLESLGCRWVMPGPFGELYPSLKTISTTLDKRENPSHSERYWWCTYGAGEGYAQWTLRNKGTYVKAYGDPVIEQGHALAAPLQWAQTQAKYAVKKKVGDKEVSVLPDEYLGLVRGKPSMESPNFSNPKVWDMYADYFITRFKENPSEQYGSLSEEDGGALDERPESRHLGGAETKTDMLLYFDGQVIDRVVKVLPGKKFGILAYGSLVPPKTTKLNPNMAIVFAPLGICPLYDVRDPRSKSDRAYAQWLPEWMRQAKATGAETYYYDYEPLGYCWNVAMICPRWGIIGRNYPWFKSMGLTGHTSQGYDDWASCGLDNYLMQKLYWNADLNYKDVIADYAKARFGAAAPAMIEYYAVYEKRMDEITGEFYSNEVWDNHLILTPEVRQAARAVLDRAVAMADTDRAKAQLQTMVELQRSTDAACDAEEIARETGDYGAAVKTLETVFEVRDRLNALYSRFMNPNRVDKKVKAQFLTGGIYNQYVGFDRKIKAASASLVLPRIWKGRLDTDNQAVALGYQNPGAAVEQLDDLDTTVMPDVKYGTQREEEAFFYRTTVNVPDNFAARKISIFFASLIASRLQIWINGQAVEFTQRNTTSTTWNGPRSFWVNYDHALEFDVTPYIKAGQENTIAFRALKNDIGGSYRRIFLLAAP